jgi:hypothetical protein
MQHVGLGVGVYPADTFTHTHHVPAPELHEGSHFAACVVLVLSRESLQETVTRDACILWRVDIYLQPYCPRLVLGLYMGTLVCTGRKAILWDRSMSH